MNDRVTKNPNFKNNGEFHRSLKARGAGARGYPNTHTEVEYLGNGKFAASIGVGHRVFFDKADGNKPEKHKLTDNRPDHVVIQGAKCCVEVYPYYAKYYDVQHEEVRLYEERWVVQRWRETPGKWADVGAWNPIITVEEYSELVGDVVKVTVTYDTDYGILTVEYFQRDGNALKHNVTFKNTSGSTETFRVLQSWAGIVGAKCNGKDPPVDISDSALNFHSADKPQRQFNATENLYSMVFNPDGSEKTKKCLQRPVRVEGHSQGMKADFIYTRWVLAQNESLEIDPATATLNDPTEDGHVEKVGEVGGGAAACLASAPLKYTTHADLKYGGTISGDGLSKAFRTYIEWDISSLAGKILTANPIFKYEGAYANDSDGEINPIKEEQPTSGGCTDAELWGYIASGIAYVDPFNVVVGENQSQDLGASTKADLQTAMTAAQSWFAIGIQSAADECPSSGHTIYSTIYSENEPGVPPPTLYVEYTVPAVYKDIATRLRLWVQAFKDISIRFKLIVQAYQDTATRFRLIVQGFQDVTTRFRLIVQGFQDTATRFRLLPLPSHQDVSTRFYLYLPSWKSLEIIKDMEALEVKVAGLKRRPLAHFEI